jgi:DNA-directed RNA polymerase sigma subunit (sigma70/sigma32)
LKTKDDAEKRYEFKEKLYELAAKRQYSLEFTNKLLTFVVELMKLPTIMERKFKEVIDNQKSIKSKDMTLSKSTVEFGDAITKSYYGETVPDVRAKLKEQDKTLAKSIILLYKRVEMSIEEIAEHLNIDAAEVRKILITNKIIKK